jgi:hypothetical protein
VLGVDIDIAPADNALALGFDRVHEELLELVAALVVVREETDGDPVLAGRRQRLADDCAEERVRHLEQDPGTVTRVAVCTRGASVLEVFEGDDRAPHGLVPDHAVQPRHEGDPAGVVLVGRVIEACLPSHALRDSHAAIDAISVEVLAPRSLPGSLRRRRAGYMPMA